MYHKKSMRIFWLSLSLLLVSGVVIIATVQINSHKKDEKRQQSIVQDKDADAEASQDMEPEGMQANAVNPAVAGNNKQSAEEHQVQPVGGKLSEYTYELKVVNGYLEVYYYHTKQLFFHTGISERALTDTQRQEIGRGKYFKDEQELYGYLESCTS